MLTKNEINVIKNKFCEPFYYGNRTKAKIFTMNKNLYMVILYKKKNEIFNKTYFYNYKAAHSFAAWYLYTCKY